MLRVDHDGGVTTLTLARPDRGNALAADLVEALLAQVRAASDEARTHTLVLCGEGRHFCTGLDLSDLDAACDAASDATLLWRLVRIETLLAALWHAPLRTVAVAQGRAWGAGADLFAACERRLAQPETTFRFPGAQFGIVLGTRRLAERVGVDTARALVTEGREWDGASALRAGLVQALAPAEDTPDWLAQATAPPRVGADTARALRAATRTDHRDADLAALVRSAAEPGLAQRVRVYVDRLRAGG